MSDQEASAKASPSEMESRGTSKTLMTPATTKAIQQGETSISGECTKDLEASGTAIPPFSQEASEAGIPNLPEEFQAPPEITHDMGHVHDMSHVTESQELRPSRMAVYIRTIYEFSYANIFWVVYYAIVISSVITSLVLAVLLDAPASWAAYAVLEVSIVGFVIPLIVKCLGWISYSFCSAPLSTPLSTSPSTSHKEPRMSQGRINAGKRAFDSPELQGAVQESSAGDTTYSSSSPQIVVLSADVHQEPVKSKSLPTTEGGTCEVVAFGTAGGSTAHS